MDPAITLWTIGHSTRGLAEFDALLERHGIEAIADVRRHPGSRRLPAYGSAALAAHLAAQGRAYCWIEALGGRRRSDADAGNDAWRNPSFRAYAAYTATEAFAEGFTVLASMGGGLRTAMMCSEAVWWRCHRRLIADVATFLGMRVLHILGPGPAMAHRIAPPARVVRARLTYAAP